MLVACCEYCKSSRAWCGLIADSGHLVLHGGDRLGIVRHPRLSDDEHRHRRLGVERPTNLINSLAAAAFIILLWDPRQLFEASFQLSFFVVLVIGLLTPPLNKISDQLLQHDPLLPDELLPQWRRGLISLFAFAGALLFRFRSPRGWAQFHFRQNIFTCSAPFQRLRISSPCRSATLALMSNLGALVCGGWFPWATGTVQSQRVFFMSAMTKVSELATQFRLILLRARAVMGFNWNLLFHPRRHFERLV